MLEEFKSLFFNTLYFWTIAFVSPLVLSFHDFLFFFLLLVRCFSCIILVCLDALFAFNDILITFQKIYIYRSLCLLINMKPFFLLMGQNMIFFEFSM
jgi:hypothetical protein